MSKKRKKLKRSRAHPCNPPALPAHHLAGALRAVPQRLWRPRARTDVALKLKTLKPRVQTQASRIPVLVPGSWRTDKQSSSARGYTYRWQKYRLHWLRQYPLCGDRLDGPSPEHSECVRAGRATPATDVDHIKPHYGDQTLFWDPKNHQSLCSKYACHDRKTKQEQQQYGG